MPSPIEPSAGGAIPDSEARGTASAASAPGNPIVTPEGFALALLVASSLQIMENLLPRIPLFPWMRVGFSYVVILPFLLQYGPRAAFALFLARNLIAILYGGQPLTTFLIGSTSGAVTFLGLGPPLAWAYRRGWLGMVGAGILMATGFNVAQLALVNLTLIRHSGFYFQTGPILAWSLVSGTAVACLILFSEKELAGLFAPLRRFRGPGAGPEAHSNESAAAWAPAGPPAAKTAPFLIGLALLAILMALPDIRVQAPMLALLAALVGQRFRILFQAWPFFFYLAWLHLFHTPGAYLWGEWITREGLHQFGAYALRLSNLILLGRWLSGHFPWQWAGRSRSPYLQGFLLALPLFTDLFRPSLEFGREMIRRLWAGQRKGVLAPAFDSWRAKMESAALAAESGSEAERGKDSKGAVEA
ncbi:MAG: Gx transporter family protein [Fibrobacteria bacterium]